MVFTFCGYRSVADSSISRNAGARDSACLQCNDQASTLEYVVRIHGKAVDLVTFLRFRPFFSTNCSIRYLLRPRSVRHRKTKTGLAKLTCGRNRRHVNFELKSDAGGPKACYIISQSEIRTELTRGCSRSAAQGNDSQAKLPSFIRFIFLTLKR